MNTNDNTKNSDIVIASRIMLVRNLSDTVFVNRMNADMKKSVAKKIYACLKSSSLGSEFDLFNDSDLSNAKVRSFVEKGYITEKLLNSETPSFFMLSRNMDISIMINEEEHIKILSYEKGQNLIGAYNKANDIDDVFINSLKIAYSEKLGFLTSSPVYLGTGLKASLILHLPALNKNGYIPKLSSMVNKLGMSLSPAFDNDAGDIYILSNLVTLGVTEKASIDNLDSVCNQIIIQEQNARELLKENADFEDKIYRNLGILKLARKLSLEEFLNGISLVRLGTSMGYFDYSIKLLNGMLSNLFDATLVDSSNSELTLEMCEKLRAEIVREKLA